MNAKDIVILVCEKKAPAPHWTHTKGIYADLSDWPRAIDYYVKCPECGNVHGFYKSLADARSKRLCQSCDFEANEKLKKEVAKVNEALPPEPFDPDIPVDPKYEIYRYTANDWVFMAKGQLEQALGERLIFNPDHYLNRDVDYDDPESFDKLAFNVEDSGVHYIVWKSEDAAEKEALEQVKNDLENEPEIYNQDWLQGFINVDKLRETLKIDQSPWTREDFDEQHSSYEDKVKAMIEAGKIAEETFLKRNGEPRKETPTLDALLERAIEEWVEQEVENRLSDPIDYLKEIYPEEEVMKHALEWGGIDYDAAVKSAVNTDGWQHFISRYDGKSIDLGSGAVAVRE